MSWLRLLAAGKSLVGLKDTVSRYRVRDRLPVFRRSDHPFRATTLPSKSAAATVEDGGKSAQAGARPGGTGGAPVEKGGESGPFRRIAARLFTSRPKTVYESGLTQPVQTELALDRVKVVRNDLTDEDVEVVRTRRTVKAAPVGATNQERAGSALESPADRGAILKC